MIKKLINLYLYFGYLHEVFHYIPARMFGIWAELHKTYVLHDSDIPSWKHIVITLCPAFVDSILVVLCVLGWVKNAKTPADHRIWAGWFLISVSWLGTCLGDFRDFVYFCRFGKWLDEV